MAIVIEGELQDKDAKTPRTKKLCSSKLFENKKELRIDHQNEIYILRITKQNKLILTK
jgi:hemin uptake protein HemP